MLNFVFDLHQLMQILVKFNFQGQFQNPQDEQIPKLSLVLIIDKDLQELLIKTKYVFITRVKDSLKAKYRTLFRSIGHNCFFSEMFVMQTVHCCRYFKSCNKRQNSFSKFTFPPHNKKTFPFLDDLDHFQYVLK